MGTAVRRFDVISSENQVKQNPTGLDLQISNIFHKQRKLDSINFKGPH